MHMHRTPRRSGAVRQNRATHRGLAGNSPLAGLRWDVEEGMVDIAARIGDHPKPPKPNFYEAVLPLRDTTKGDTIFRGDGMLDSPMIPCLSCAP